MPVPGEPHPPGRMSRQEGRPLRLTPGIQRYAWGDSAFLQPLLEAGAGDEPFAELWFGAHPLAPATVEMEEGAIPLDRLLGSRTEALLGPDAGARFGGLPYLLKILAAARPLSIQVHPDAERAKAGFAREEAAGIPLEAPDRTYRDPYHKPELLVALTRFHAICGFLPPGKLAGALTTAPEVAELLPAFDQDGSVRQILKAYLALPEAILLPALTRLLGRLAEEEDTAGSSPDQPGYWVLRAHRELGVPGGAPDRGLFLVYLMELLQLEPGEGLFVPPGVPHSYLSGAAVEVMANSDNVIRAGLTSKRVAPLDLLEAVDFSERPRVVRGAAGPEGPQEEHYPVPVEEFALRLLRPAPGTPLRRAARGAEILLALPDAPDVVVTVGISGDGGAFRLPLRRGEACLVPHGTEYTLEASREARVFRVTAPDPQDQPSAAEGDDYLSAVRHNIEGAADFFRHGDPPALVGTVSGSAAARDFWAAELEAARGDFRAREVVSLHEELPVNQAFGLLLLWERLRPHLRPQEGALIAFVFGEGTRATPFTEAECGQKAAMSSFVALGEGDARRYLSTAELALRHFAPVEGYLRRSGFDGIVVKWGDEVQIPTLDLQGTDRRLAGADVVRFVSLQAMTPDTAANKDWVGVDPEGRITAFIPRRPLEAMAPLAEAGLVQRRGSGLVGGINLGSVALSRRLLDLLLEEFRGEVHDPEAVRSRRPDLDPQFFTALTIAAEGDPQLRERRWESAKAESGTIARLEEGLPGVLVRLRGVLDRYLERHGREARMVALDFGDQYWGDMGQHPQIFAAYTALADPGAPGEVARALAGVEWLRDTRGNLFTRDTVLGPGVEVRNSVLLDARVERGEIVDSVLIGTRCGELRALGAFDVRSTAVAMHLPPRSGAYRVVGPESVEAGVGERMATVFLPGGPVLLRVHERTDLRDRAANYDRPVCGNPLSFREAHALVTGTNPLALKGLRSEAERRVAEEIRRGVGRLPSG